MHGQQNNNEHYGLIVGHLKVRSDCSKNCWWFHGSMVAERFSRKPNFEGLAGLPAAQPL